MRLVEQMRVAADSLRQRIIQPLTRQRMTVTQVGEMLTLSPAKVYYHMRELERVGLVRMVETREKGGILEKYYQAAGKNIVVSPSLLQAMSPEEHVASIGAFLQNVSREFLQGVGRAGEDQADGAGAISLNRTQFWATDEEFGDLLRQVDALFEPYLEPRCIEGEREQTFVAMGYNAANEEGSAGTVRDDAHRRTMFAGIMVCDREGIEKRLARGEVADMTVFGICRFADDVPAELVDRYVHSFHHRGVLQASPEVRAVLERKKEVTPDT